MVPYRTVNGRGFIGNVSQVCNVSVTIANQGGHAEIFNVTILANTTVVNLFVNVSLLAGDSVVRNAVWNVTSFSYGNYTLQAVADVVPGETNITDNTLAYNKTVVVTIMGDVNGDGTVDIYDALALAGAYDSVPASLSWNSNADINGDNTVDIYDAIILSSNYNKSF
jgi:hypothetical protein